MDCMGMMRTRIRTFVLDYYSVLIALLILFLKIKNTINKTHSTSYKYTNNDAIYRQHLSIYLIKMFKLDSTYVNIIYFFLVHYWYLLAYICKSKVYSFTHIEYSHGALKVTLSMPVIIIIIIL